MLTAVPKSAFAHSGINHTTGILYGLGHPISGLDHILAMVMVGLFAFQLGGRATFLVPASFVTSMAVGGALGAASIPVPFAETGIALSVVVLGLIIALNARSSVRTAMCIVGVSAIFHGYAHGAEMPESAGGFAYAVGFIMGTAVLHAAGIATGIFFRTAGHRGSRFATQMLGGFSALAGVGLLGISL